MVTLESLPSVLIIRTSCVPIDLTGDEKDNNVDRHETTENDSPIVSMESSKAAFPVTATPTETNKNENGEKKPNNGHGKDNNQKHNDDEMVRQQHQHQRLLEDFQATLPLSCDITIMPELQQDFDDDDMNAVEYTEMNATTNTAAPSTAAPAMHSKRRGTDPIEQVSNIVQVSQQALSPCGSDNVMLLPDLLSDTIVASTILQGAFLLSLTNCHATLLPPPFEEGEEEVKNDNNKKNDRSSTIYASTTATNTDPTSIIQIPIQVTSSTYSFHFGNDEEGHQDGTNSGESSTASNNGIAIGISNGAFAELSIDFDFNAQKQTILDQIIERKWSPPQQNNKRDDDYYNDTSRSTSNNSMVLDKHHDININMISLIQNAIIRENEYLDTLLWRMGIVAFGLIAMYLWFFIYFVYPRHNIHQKATKTMTSSLSSTTNLIMDKTKTIKTEKEFSLGNDEASPIWTTTMTRFVSSVLFSSLRKSPFNTKFTIPTTTTNNNTNHQNKDLKDKILESHNKKKAMLLEDAAIDSKGKTTKDDSTSSSTTTQPKGREGEDLENTTKMNSCTNNNDNVHITNIKLSHCKGKEEEGNEESSSSSSSPLSPTILFEKQKTKNDESRPPMTFVTLKRPILVKNHDDETRKKTDIGSHHLKDSSNPISSSSKIGLSEQKYQPSSSKTNRRHQHQLQGNEVDVQSNQNRHDGNIFMGNSQQHILKKTSKLRQDVNDDKDDFANADGGADLSPCTKLKRNWQEAKPHRRSLRKGRKDSSLSPCRPLVVRTPTAASENSMHRNEDEQSSFSPLQDDVTQPPFVTLSKTPIAIDTNSTDHTSTTKVAMLITEQQQKHYFKTEQSARNNNKNKDLNDEKSQSLQTKNLESTSFLEDYWGQ